MNKVRDSVWRMSLPCLLVGNVSLPPTLYKPHTYRLQAPVSHDECSKSVRPVVATNRVLSVLRRTRISPHTVLHIHAYIPGMYTIPGTTDVPGTKYEVLHTAVSTNTRLLYVLHF